MRARAIALLAGAAAAGLAGAAGDGARLGTPERCSRYDGLPPGWPSRDTAGMVWVPAGAFIPGTTRGYADERPGGPVRVDGFWIDRTEVTNAQFAAFVRATGYITDAERAGAGAVLRPGATDAPADWWGLQPGASWRSPFGPAGPAAEPSHPVVQLTHADAHAYARWLGNELPTEAQWEYAARSGGDGSGAPADAAGRPVANYWQGDFPRQNLVQDGFAALAPVGCFPANAWGLHDTVGNVWEWTRDEYRGWHPRPGACHPQVADPQRARVIKGGSYLCAATFCARYRATARHPQQPAMATAHVGFRTVKAP